MMRVHNVLQRDPLADLNIDRADRSQALVPKAYSSQTSSNWVLSLVVR